MKTLPKHVHDSIKREGSQSIDLIEAVGLMQVQETILECTRTKCMVSGGRGIYTDSVRQMREGRGPKSRLAAVWRTILLGD